MAKEKLQGHNVNTNIEKIKVETTRIKLSLIFVFVVLVVWICIIVFAGLSQKAAEESRNKATANVVEESEFKTLLDNVIKEKSKTDDANYVLDENYYDEQIIRTYISIMADVSSDKIESEHIKNLF